MITVKDFLDEFTEEHMPRKTGPWISFDAHDPAFKRDELRAMRKQGIIELDEPARRYRILEAALANASVEARRILFMTDETLEIGAIYKIAESESTNRFRCVATHNPNGTMFVREHDGMVHLGREFIEYRNGERYYAVEKVSSANTEITNKGSQNER